MLKRSGAEKQLVGGLGDVWTKWMEALTVLEPEEDGQAVGHRRQQPRAPMMREPRGVVRKWIERVYGALWPLAFPR